MRTEDDDFVDLKQGEYWRAIETIPGTPIIKDDVLLLESIRDVDKKAHTVILRTHPAIYDKYIWMPREDGGRSSVRFKEHRFLVNDFLRLFVEEPNHEDIRRLEVEKIQKRIGDLQTEVAAGDAGSLEMKLHLADGSRKWEEKRQLEAGSSSTIASTRMVALTPSITPKDIDDMKLSAEFKHEIATLKANWIKEKVERISETVNSMVPYFQEKAAAALSRTEDVFRYVDKLQKSIQSLDLYVGTNVEVVQLKKGASASADVPLTIMQHKLYADEELSVFLDVDEDFDHLGVPRFLKALADFPKLVEQLFASPRSIVAFAATRRERDYGDAWSNMQRNAENRRVGLLIRDGDNLWQVNSPIDSHIKSHNLFPGRVELDNIFLKYRGAYSSFKLDDQNINFMDVEYTDRLEAHEAFALHYKRFLILMAGLDHRLNLFGIFYNEEKSMDFISPEFQEKYFRFVHDDDGEFMLPLPNKQKLQDWIDEKNSYLRSGARVLCDWLDVMTLATAPGVIKQDTYSSSRESYLVADPDEKISVAIARREGKDIIVSCPVTRRGWRNENKKFEARVNLSLAKDRLSFLVLDAVTAEEMEYYIHSREVRLQHLSYMKFFKLAVKHLRQEEVYEKEPRAMLRQALADGGLATGQQAEDVIQQTVIAWRAAHRGEHLPSRNIVGELDQAKHTTLLNQMHVQLNAGSHKTAAEEFAKSIDRTPLRLVVTGKDRMILYVAPTAEERDDRLCSHMWANAIGLQRNKTGFKETTRRWALLPQLSASETTLHEWEAAKDWAGLGSKITFYEKQEMFNTVSRFEESYRTFIDHPSLSLAKWAAKTRELSTGGYVHQPSLVFPVGILRSKRGGDWHFVSICHDHSYALLHNTTEEETLRKTIHDTVVERYSDKSHAKSQFRKAIDGPNNGWYLSTAKADAFKKGNLLNHLHRQGWLPVSMQDFNNSLETYLDRCVAEWAKEKSEDGSTYHLLGRGTPEGPINLDTFLGIDLRHKKFLVEWVDTRKTFDDPKPFDQSLTIYPLDDEGEPIGYTEDYQLLKNKAKNGMSSHSKGKFYTIEDARAYIQDGYDVEQSTAEGAVQPIVPDVERWWVKMEKEEEEG